MKGLKILDEIEATLFILYNSKNSNYRIESLDDVIAKRRAPTNLKGGEKL